MTVTARLTFALAILLATTFFTGCHATSPIPSDKRPVPLGKRNVGGKLKDWYLSKFTRNYFCTDTGRLVPVDPETGHMLLKGLRKRDFIDNFFHHSHSTEHGVCKHRM